MTEVMVLCELDTEHWAVTWDGTSAACPKNVQENIMQSGVVFHTEQDMRRCVEYLMESKN